MMLASGIFASRPSLAPDGPLSPTAQEFLSFIPASRIMPCRLLFYDISFSVLDQAEEIHGPFFAGHPPRGISMIP
jgi:hypothetical protein